jgi:Secreted repeat of unknown function
MRKALAGAALLAALATVAVPAATTRDPERWPGRSRRPRPPQAASRATVAVTSSRLGDILVDGDGRTVYAFTKDQGDQSACSGERASNWPALTGTATTGTGV